MLCQFMCVCMCVNLCTLSVCLLSIASDVDVCRALREYIRMYVSVLCMHVCVCMRVCVCVCVSM